MKNYIQLIRNASLKINYNSACFLVDPMFSPKHSFESYAGFSKNPTVDLPISIPDILNDVEGVFLTHTHEDHFDQTAINYIDYDLRFFVQNEDETYVKDKGFNNLRRLSPQFEWKHITFNTLDAFHGRGQLRAEMGSVKGLFFTSTNQASVYIVGDSIYNDSIRHNIAYYQPDYILANVGGAEFPHLPDNPIIMPPDELESLINDLNYQPTIIAIHLEAIDHCQITRAEIQTIKDHYKTKINLLVPDDGTIITLK